MGLSRRTLLKASASAMALATVGATPRQCAHGAFGDETWWAWYERKPLGPALDAQAVRLGRRPTVIGLYSSWHNPGGQPSFPRADLDAIVARNQQPLLTWQPDGGIGYHDPAFAPVRILAGVHDWRIRSFARQARDWGRPLWVRIFHEADLRAHGQYVWQQGSAWDVIRAWRYVVDMVRPIAPNVRWVWNPSASPDRARLANVFPGRHWVDHGGFDLYGNPEWNGGWHTFADLAALPYAHMAELTGNRTMIVGEYGQTERNADWLRSMMPMALRDRFPLIRAVVYFDASLWRLNGEALNTYRTRTGFWYMGGKL